MRCMQAASGMLASSWHMNTSRRQGEALRWHWSLTGVEGVSEESIPPVSGVGMPGMLQQYQDAQGTGFYMVNWGCKVRCHATCVLTVISYLQGCMNIAYQDG
jgi:hypothetical protein